MLRLFWRLRSHRKCCKRAALHALAEHPPSSQAFNKALEHGYVLAEARGCKASGFERRFFIYCYVLREVGWKVN